MINFNKETFSCLTRLIYISHFIAALQYISLYTAALESSLPFLDCIEELNVAVETLLEVSNI